MAADPANTSNTDRSLAGFTMFVAAWSIYTLMHQALTYGAWFKFDEIDKLVINALPFVMAIFTLGRPSSVGRFTLLLLSIAALKLWQMPYMGNHLFFTMCATLSMLLCIGYRAALPGGGHGPLAARSFDLFAPVVRLQILMLYFWVVVHKLNWDYLDPEVSCAWSLYLGVVDFMQVRFGIPLSTNSWLAYPGMYGALLAEAVIPLLLAFQKTRKLGVFIGLMFHLMLSFHKNEYIASFSLMLYAIYVLFLPAAVWVTVVEHFKSMRLGGWLARAGWRMSAVIVALLMVYAGAIVALTAAGGAGLGKQAVIDTLHRYSDPVIFLVWLAYAALCITLFVRIRYTAWSPADAGWARVSMPLFYVLPLLVLVNGASPYVGLKTHHAFAMFSNLRTEAGQTNHLFLPVSLRVVPYQDQPVAVIASDMVQLPVTADGERMTWFEFRRLIHQAQPGTTITYQREGEGPVTLRAEEIADHPELAPPAYWLLKTQLYKAVPAEDRPCPCRH